MNWNKISNVRKLHLEYVSSQTIKNKSTSYFPVFTLELRNLKEGQEMYRYKALKNIL